MLLFTRSAVTSTNQSLKITSARKWIPLLQYACVIFRWRPAQIGETCQILKFVLLTVLTPRNCKFSFFFTYSYFFLVLLWFSVWHWGQSLRLKLQEVLSKWSFFPRLITQWEFPELSYDRIAPWLLYLCSTSWEKTFSFVFQGLCWSPIW